MKLLHSLLLAPVLSLAATTGSVTLLDGTPIAGAVIKSLTDSVVTTANGSFALGRATGIASRSSKTISVTSHLTVENGHPRLTFAGMDISGRSRNSAATARQNLSSIGVSFAARSLAAPDTLKVYWKGKRLTVLPVTSDTTVTFRIDTAWKDDAGIPWNPAITYGSLFDSRDGQTYRTVTIGTQTWMAENLNWHDKSETMCYDRDTVNCRIFGGLYRWSFALGQSDWCNINKCANELSNPENGICPLNWHIPRNAEWDKLKDTTFINQESGIQLASTVGWLDYSGLDKYGFRALPSGSGSYRIGVPFNARSVATEWWSADETPRSDGSSYSYVITNISKNIYYSYNTFKTNWLSVRCLKD